MKFPEDNIPTSKHRLTALAWGIAYDEVLGKYKEANEIFGDIVKVTPSSKIVGDMAFSCCRTI
jgi:pyruvate carboxylase